MRILKRVIAFVLASVVFTVYAYAEKANQIEFKIVFENETVTTVEEDIISDVMDEMNKVKPTFETEAIALQNEGLLI